MADGRGACEGGRGSWHEDARRAWRGGGDPRCGGVAACGRSEADWRLDADRLCAPDRRLHLFRVSGNGRGDGQGRFVDHRTDGVPLVLHRHRAADLRRRCADCDSELEAGLRS